MEDIVSGLRRLGGTGTYDEVFAEVADLRQRPLPNNWQDTIGRALERHCSPVEGIGEPVWQLSPPPPVKVDLKGLAQSRSGGAYTPDSVVRRAIEDYAMERAERYYTGGRGGPGIMRVGTQYALRVDTLDRVVQVVVKGSTRRLTSVILTRNEVDHAREPLYPEDVLDLFVVEDIELETDPEGFPKLTGGSVRVWTDWSPAEEDLLATEYAYTLSVK